MMKRIDFENTKPDFDNGQTKWYLDKYFNNYIKNVQAENLPSLKNIMCFVVKGESIIAETVEDYVLIDDKQGILASYRYTSEGFQQMESKINIIKITKNYDKHENKISNF